MDKIKAIESKCTWNAKECKYEYNYEIDHSKGHLEFYKGMLSKLKLSALNKLYKLVCGGNN